MREVLRSITRKVRSLLDYIDYRRHLRARLKKAKKDDPNIYPMW